MDEPSPTHDDDKRAMLRASDALFALGLGTEDDELDGASTTVDLHQTAAQREYFSQTIQAGKKIGHFVLKEELGEGGFGTVWLAEQKVPIQRTAAVKLIKPGMSTRYVITRFESERQTVAMMQHPNIAAVLEAGTTDQDLPYFVMELVKGGRPITLYCDQQRLDIRERLQLFLPVCHAVQHAHQKAILHRDLKPSNILVGETEDGVQPKIIDFGIAKALGPTLRERQDQSAELTSQGQIIGTPQYMSPEQSEGSPEVDTRSDIYALGAILYELLAGRAPLSDRMTPHTAFDEMLRVIRDVDPIPPSQRVLQGEVDSRMADAAAVRQSDPRKLSQTLRRDLDWIVLKALAKEPVRRYESASALALDIQRYLTDQPVTASPPSQMYFLAKFVRRNRAVVIAGAVAAAALIGGVWSTVWSLLQQQKALQEKIEVEQIAREEAEKNVRSLAFVGSLFQNMTFRNSSTLTPEALIVFLNAANERRAADLKQQPESNESVSRLLAQAYRELDQLNVAESLYGNALTLLRSMNKGSTQAAAECLFWIPWIHSHQTSWDVRPLTFEADREMITQCQKILTDLDPQPKELLLKARVLEATLLRQGGDAVAAGKIIQELQTGPEQQFIQNSDVSGWVRREQALLEMQAHHYPLAARLLDESLHLLSSTAANENIRRQIKVDILGLQSLLQLESGRNEDALQTAEQANDIRLTWIGKADPAMLIRMADALSKLDRYYPAIAKLQQALPLARDNRDMITLESALLKLLDLYRLRFPEDSPIIRNTTLQLTDVLLTQLDHLVEPSTAWQSKLDQITNLLRIRTEIRPPYSHDDAMLILAHANLRARQGDLAAAVADIDTVRHLFPGDHSLAFRKAVYSVKLGRMEDCEAELKTLLALPADQVAATNAGYWACRMVSLCPLTRAHMAEIDRLLSIKSDLSDWSRLYYGMLDYYSGSYASAQEWLEGILQAEDPVIAAQAQLFNSLTHHQLHQPALAKAELDKAQSLFENRLQPGVPRDPVGPQMPDTESAIAEALAVQMMLDEVRATLAQPPPAKNTAQ